MTSSTRETVHLGQVLGAAIAAELTESIARADARAWRTYGARAAGAAGDGLAIIAKEWEPAHSALLALDRAECSPEERYGDNVADRTRFQRLGRQTATVRNTLANAGVNVPVPGWLCGEHVQPPGWSRAASLDLLSGYGALQQIFAAVVNAAPDSGPGPQVEPAAGPAPDAAFDDASVLRAAETCLSGAAEATQRIVNELQIIGKELRASTEAPQAAERLRRSARARGATARAEASRQLNRYREKDKDGPGGCVEVRRMAELLREADLFMNDITSPGTWMTTRQRSIRWAEDAAVRARNLAVEVEALALSAEPH